MCVWFIPPYTPLLYSKTGVYRGIYFFLIFALKHRLWVLISVCIMGHVAESTVQYSIDSPAFSVRG